MTEKFEISKSGDAETLALNLLLCHEQGLGQLHSTNLVNRETESQAGAFVNGLADGAYRQPLRAIQQLAGNAEALAPDKHDANADGGQSRKVGQIIGSLVPFAALGIVTKGVSNGLFGAEAAPTLLRSMGEQASTGFLLGSLMSPSDLKPGESLAGARLYQGGVSALTFATMAGSSNLLDRALPKFGGGTLPLLGRQFSIAALSGAAGGIMDVEARNKFNASGAEVMSSAAGFAAFGIAMEGGGMLAKSVLRNATATEQAPQISGLNSDHGAAKLQKAGFPDLEIDQHNLSRNLREPSEGAAGDHSNQPLPRELNGFKELLAEFSEPGPKTEKASPNNERVNEIFALIDNAENLEPKIQSVAAPLHEQGWTPDSRLKLLSHDELPYARERLLDEFKSFEGGGSEQPFELYQELMRTNWLTDAQKIRLTDVVCQVRDYYAHLNNGDNPTALKAQASWVHSEAALVDVITSTKADLAKGVKPESTALENKILSNLFSQFRFHEDGSESAATPEKLHADIESSAKTILRETGYSKERILQITNALKQDPLQEQSLDQVVYDQGRLKAFRPDYKDAPAQRDAKLTTTTAIAENWKIPVGEETHAADGTTITKWSNESGNGELRRNAQQESLVLDNANNRHFIYDANGVIKEAAQVDERSFFYDKSGNLHRVESATLGDLYRSKKGDWFKDLGPDDDGAPRVEQFWKGKIVADDNGSLRLIKNDASQVRVFSIDGSETWHPETGRTEFKSANYGFEQALLKERVATAFGDKVRQLRMDGLIDSFEKESTERGLGENEKALFYKQLNRLLVNKDGMALPLESRRDLAEEATNHAAFPTTIDQGSNPTCNVTTIENRTYTRRPQDMARMLADITESGSYTTNSGRVIDMARSLTGLKPDAEARESLKLQAEGKADIKVDGDRDWASQLAQLVMVKIKHLNTTEFVAKDTLVDDVDLVFDNHSTLIGKVKQADIEPLLDNHGKEVKSLSAGEVAYRKAGEKLEKVSAENLVFDKNGELSGSITDRAKIQKLFDYFGNQFNKLVPGSNYFDESGNLVMYQTVPGDITYDKFSPTQKPELEFKPSDEAARLNVRHLGKNIFLKEPTEDGKGEFIDSPLLNVNYYRDIANEVTGVEKAPFSIARGSEHKTFHSAIRVSNEAEFAEEMRKMQDSGNLPGILRVHTRNWPFNHKRGGWHVVNLQGYDDAKKLVEFSNQWGSAKDHVGENAVPLSRMFEAMMEPKDPPPPLPPKPVVEPPLATNPAKPGEHPILNPGSFTQWEQPRFIADAGKSDLSKLANEPSKLPNLSANPFKPSVQQNSPKSFGNNVELPKLLTDVFIPNFDINTNPKPPFGKRS